jgi:membrane protease YdiL (CAAX protease family)
MLKKSLLACVRALGLLLAVYLPTFAIVSTVFVSPTTSAPADATVMIAALPYVIGLSLVIAVMLIAVIGGRQFRSYGFRSVPGKTVLFSLALGLGIGFALRWVARSFGIEEPSVFTGLTTWQIIAFMWVGAPIQEEIIFRGLFQTTLEKGIPTVISVGRWRLSVAAIGGAVAFSLVHLGLSSVGASWGEVAFVAAGALLLGALAGQFRWRTGSLVPGIVIHALFNVPGSVGL